MDQITDHSKLIHEEFPGVSPRPEVQAPIKNESREKWLRRIKLAGALGMTAIIGVTGLAGEMYAGDVMTGPQLAKEYILQQQAKEISPSEIAQVESELNQPSYIHEFLNSSKDTGEKAEFNYVKKEAEARGFELADYPALLEQAKQTKNVTEFLSLLNNYTQKNYGFTIMFPEHLGTPEIGMGIDTLDPKIINKPENFALIRDGLLAIMGAYSFIPKEIIKDSGPREIMLVKSVGPVYANTEAIGEANVITDRIYLGPEIFSEPDNAAGAVHELGHILDGHFNSLRGMDHDPGFAKNNRRGFSYNTNTKSGYKVGYDVSDPYSRENKTEDKADIYSEILMAIPDYAYTQTNSPEKAKAIYLLAEIERHYPGFTAYMNAITDRQN